MYNLASLTASLDITRVIAEFTLDAGSDPG